MRGLPAVHLAAHLTLRVVNRDAALRTLHEHDAHQNRQHARQQHQRKDDIHVAGPDLLVGARDRGGSADHDAREDDE